MGQIPKGVPHTHKQSPVLSTARAALVNIVPEGMPHKPILMYEIQGPLYTLASSVTKLDYKFLLQRTLVHQKHCQPEQHGTDSRHCLSPQAEIAKPKRWLGSEPTHEGA